MHWLPVFFAAALSAEGASAATYDLPDRIGSAPFASCSLTSGTTYTCAGNVAIGNGDTVRFNTAMTLNVTGSFTLGNNGNIYGGGNAVTIVAGGNITLGNSFVGSVNFDAGGNFVAGNTATITGNISADGNIVVGNNTNITGNVDADGNLNVGSGTITGTCTYATTNFTCTSSATLDHVRIEHSGAGVTCLREPVIVKACQDAACSSLYTAGSVSLVLSPSGGWYSAASGGAAADTLTFSGSATRYLQKTTTGTAVLSASGISPNASNGVKCYVGATQDCNLIFTDAGFIVSSAANGAEAAIPTQTAGTASVAYYLRAVKTSTTSQACEAALTGSTAVDLAYQCNNPTTCYTASAPACGIGSGYFCLTPYNGAAAQTAVPVAANPNTGITTYSAVTLYFDANGNAPLTFNYSDVGQIRLVASKAAGGSLITALNGSTNAFVVKPAGFALSDIKCTTANAANCGTGALGMASPGDNPGAADASGGTFIRAGHPFSVTVAAKASGGATTPSFGREDAPEEVTLALTLVAPSSGNTGMLANATISGGSFSNGVATAGNLSWSEVGIVTLTPANGDYLGAGSVTGTASGNVGRFYPDHFDTDVSHACAAGSFTYSGQPFPLKVTARNAGSAKTGNYTGTFAKTVTLADANGAAGAFNPATLSASDFAAGEAAVSVSFSYANKLSGPSVLRVRAVDSDGTTSASTEGQTRLRSGRLRISNAFGSEKSPLAVPIQAQYWSGNSWVLNGDDTCTSLPANTFALSGGISAKTSVSGAMQIGVLPNTGGNGTLMLAAPAGAVTGNVDVAANLGTSGNDVSCLSSHGGTAAGLPWLRSRNGNCASTYDRDPAARATFGIYTPETRRTVHIREQF